jgi:hypothetical protein
LIKRKSPGKEKFRIKTKKKLFLNQQIFACLAVSYRFIEKILKFQTKVAKAKFISKVRKGKIIAPIGRIAVNQYILICKLVTKPYIIL